jgi:hypothetical protein
MKSQHKCTSKSKSKSSVCHGNIGAKVNDQNGQKILHCFADVQPIGKSNLSFSSDHSQNLSKYTLGANYKTTNQTGLGAEFVRQNGQDFYKLGANYKPTKQTGLEADFLRQNGRDIYKLEANYKPTENSKWYTNIA